MKNKISDSGESDENLFKNDFSAENSQFEEFWHSRAEEKIEFTENLEIPIANSFSMSLATLYISLFFLQNKHKLSKSCLSDILKLVIAVLNSSSFLQNLEEKQREISVPKTFQTVNSFFKKMGFAPTKFYCEKKTRKFELVPSKPLKNYHTVLYFPIITTLKLIEFLKPNFFSKFIVENQSQCPNNFALRIWRKFLKGRSLFLGGGSDGLSVFKSSHLEVTPSISYFIPAKKSNANDQRDTSITEYFINTIFSMNCTSIDRVDFFFTPQIDELVYLMKNGIEIDQKNTKVVQEFMGCDLKQKKMSNLTPKWNQKQGCDHCLKSKEVHDSVSCWPGRSGPPRYNTTQLQADNGALVSQFQKLPYYTVKYYFPPDIMHHVYCDGVASKVLKSITSSIEKDYFENEKQFENYCHSLKIHIPSDHGRNLRLFTSKHFHKYKAAEIRNLSKTTFLPAFENMIEAEKKGFFGI